LRIGVNNTSSQEIVHVASGGKVIWRRVARYELDLVSMDMDGMRSVVVVVNDNLNNLVLAKDKRICMTPIDPVDLMLAAVK
jgi:hypothetical protein